MPVSLTRRTERMRVTVRKSENEREIVNLLMKITERERVGREKS